MIKKSTHMSLSQEKLIYMAKVCEDTGRDEELIEYMKQYFQYGDEISKEEQTLILAAYRNIFGSKMSSLRILEAIRQKDEQKGSLFPHLIEKIKIKILGEVDTLKEDLFDLIDILLVRNCKSTKTRLSVLKMKGEFFKYLYHCYSGDLSSKMSQKFLKTYNEAYEVACRDLRKTDPITLSLALGLCVWNYEVCNDPKKALDICKTAFDDAISEFECISEEEYRECTPLMQLLRDNLTLYLSEESNEE